MSLLKAASASGVHTKGVEVSLVRGSSLVRHFSTLMNRQFSRSHCRTCWTWWVCSVWFWEKTRMWSRYTKTKRFRKSQSMSFTRGDRTGRLEE